uniref:Uncharacterized protein n=1 Tax=Chaetoceros debilis TaxID=122233 RepID=A0A7S3QH27_9STRA|mmetsp:Transcript_13396/g.19529  ORF Transcript_13396/g.19529 Transcript_13396/m.19529 type:complete len:1196 (-) Transcript_13396:11-3598(-)
MIHEEGNCWQLELNLTSAQIIALFNDIRGNPSFSHQWFSTTALVDIINHVFELSQHFIALEIFQFNRAIKKLEQSTFTECLKMCPEGMVCRTTISNNIQTRERCYCFPKPCKKRRGTRNNEPNVRRSRRSSKGSEKKHQQSSNSVVPELPPIPIIQLMHNPPILAEVKSRNSIYVKNVADVILFQLSNQGMPATVKSPSRGIHTEDLPVPLPVVSPDLRRKATVLFQVEEQFQSRENRLIQKLKLVPVWESKTARNLFGFSRGVGLKSEITKVGKRLLYASNDDDMLVSFLPTETDRLPLQVLTTSELQYVRKKARYLGTAYTFAIEQYGWTARQEGKSTGICWGDICKKAVELENRAFAEKDQISFRTLFRWNQGFRVTKTLIPKLPPDLRTRPKFLLDNPEESLMIAEWIRSRLDDFEVNDLIKFIHEEIIGNMAKYKILRKENLVDDLDDLVDGDDIRSRIQKAIADNDHYLRHINLHNTKNEILRENGLSSICTATVYKWMQHLGFKNKKFEKTFRTDGHERPENIQDRISHCLRYLKLERKCYRWVRVPKQSVDALVDAGILPIGYHKLGKHLGSSNLIEFHIDTHEVLEVFVTPQGQQYGGDLAYNFPPGTKPIMIIGQDELTFESNNQRSDTWIDKDGKGAMRPKGRGFGLMCSSFICREWGSGLQLSPEIIRAANNKRENCEYTVPSCAELLGLSKMKKDALLSSDRATEFFWYGKNNFWKCENFAIQFEDINDLLDVHPKFNGFERIFCFDWSMNHKKALDDGLKSSDMGMKYGGVQTVQRISELCQESIGNCTTRRSQIAYVGAKYSHHFQPGSIGPVDMLPEEQEYHRLHDRKENYVWKSDAKLRKVLADHTIHGQCVMDILSEDDTDMKWLKLVRSYKLSKDRLRYLCFKYGINEGKERKPINSKSSEIKLTDRDIIDLLESERLATTGSPQILRNRCKSNNLPITRSVETGIMQSWEGKAKGLVTICVERGLIHLQKVLVENQHYTKNGKKVNGEIDSTTSLVAILGECADFKKEFSILEKIAERYSATVWFTPKYHCEIAGEGVEYMWGYDKRVFRRIPLALRKKKQDFEKRVRETVCEDVNTSTIIRRFSRRARQYICAYHHIHSKESTSEKVQVSLKEVEKVVKKLKTKRSALDISFGFIEAEVKKSLKKVKPNSPNLIALKLMAVPYTEVKFGSNIEK